MSIITQVGSLVVVAGILTTSSGGDARASNRSEVGKLAITRAHVGSSVPTSTKLAKWCGGRWVKSVDWIGQHDGHWLIRVDPTTRARYFGAQNLGAVWREMNTCVPVPIRTYPYRRGTDAASAWNQLWCHAYFSVGGFGRYLGGIWELETWRAPYPSLPRMISTRCNW